MKRFTSLVSWLLLLAASGIGIAILIGQPPLPYSDPKRNQSRQEIAGKLSSSFPIDQTRFIDFDIDDSSGSQLSPRELVDQKRDWLLFTIASASGAAPSTISRSLFDLAPIRHGYLNQLCRFEYGVTRSICLSASRIVALVPKSAEQTRLNDLARVFDEARKNLGTAPETIEVFEYTFEGSSKATITRRASIPGSVFLSPASGYREVAVSTAPDLRAFMSNVDDLVFAKIEDNQLRLGGRKLPNAGIQNIGLEEVAAIWQSEQMIQARRQQFDERWKQRVERLNAEWKDKVYFSQQEYDLAFAALQREHDNEMKGVNLVNGSGFSLDPTYDYAGLAAALSESSLSEVLATTSWSQEKKQLYLEAARKLILRETNTSEFIRAPLRKRPPVEVNNLSLAALMQVAKFPDTTLTDVIRNLAPQADLSSRILAKDQEDSTPNVVPFLTILEKAKRAASAQNCAAGILAGILRELNDHFRLQKARYDGPLQGTEAGMVLFYTDLLAKLWALDYVKNTPSKAIEEFEPLTRTILPSLYRGEERALPHTRLWFGPEDYGYQVLTGNMVAFARNATRIYAASSNPLEPGKETEPKASANAFLGWWNDHYEEVAQYEPQYSRLNQIMKWSVLISWLNGTSSSQLLKCLGEVAVDRSAWFPDWARKSSLRFSEWNRVAFYPRGYLGLETEAMPILFSESYREFADEDPANPQWTLNGGVSLASKDLLETRVPIPESVPQLLRRSNLDYVKSKNKVEELFTTRGTRYQFQDRVLPRLASQEVSTTKILPKEGLKFRSRYGDLKVGQMEWTVTGSEAGIQVEAKAGSSQIGCLEVMPSKNGFRVGWHAREVDDGFTIARRLSSASDIDTALRIDPLVECALKDSSGVYYVKSAAARKWLKIAPEGQNAPEISTGWDGRVADLTAEAKPVNIAWLDEEKIPREVVDSGNWVRGPPPRGPRPRASGGEMDEFPNGQLTWREAARAILKDPAEVKRLADSYFVRDLREIDLLLSSRKPQKALSLIDDRLIKFGDHEQLRLRQSFAELDRGRTEASVEALGDLHLESRDQCNALINEINARLKVAKAADDRLYKIAEAIDWENLPTKPPGDKVLVATDKEGKLSIDLKLGSAPTGNRISPSNVPIEAIVYWENAPGLNKVDWSVGVRRALDQITEQQLGVAIELPRADIAHFNPAHIKISNTQFSPCVSAHETNISLPKVYIAWNGSGNNSDDDEKKRAARTGSMASEQPAKVYLLVARPGTSPDKPTQG